MGDIILTMKGIDKSFPGVHALDHVDLEVRKGEVLALMGENGAGKSTLMKVLTGIYKKDSGTITYEGKEVEFKNTREAQDAGIVIVHQELNMLGHLTVAQNLFIGREFKKGITIDDKKMNEEAKKLFDRLNVDIDPKEKMSNLTVGKQQMCEIAKAVSFDAKVIIFDEPSAALTEAEIEEAYSLVDPELIEVIRKAIVNIRSFHEKQKQYSWFDSKPDGTILGQKVTALARVGVYVPGGKAAYPSSVLMNVLPAKVAGVEQIIMCTPPDKEGKVYPTTLVAAKEAGVDVIYKAG